MGYYQCPRCSSTDAYMGNQMVHRRGAAVSAEIGNTGVYATRQVGGGTETVQVAKCRKCGEILIAENYRLTAEEMWEAERQRRLDRHYAVKIFAAVFLIMALEAAGLGGRWYKGGDLVTFIVVVCFLSTSFVGAFVVFAAQGTLRHKKIIAALSFLAVTAGPIHLFGTTPFLVTMFLSLVLSCLAYAAVFSRIP